MTKLIKRTYRITKEHDKIVKKNAKKYGSESSVIRGAIEMVIVDNMRNSVVK